MLRRLHGIAVQGKSTLFCYPFNVQAIHINCRLSFIFLKRVTCIITHVLLSVNSRTGTLIFSSFKKTAWDCPPQKINTLLSSTRKLHGKSTLSINIFHILEEITQKINTVYWCLSINAKINTLLSSTRKLHGISTLSINIFHILEEITT